MFANPDYTAPRLQVSEVKWLEFSVRTWAFFYNSFYNVKQHKTKNARRQSWDMDRGLYPVEETTMMARGLTRSVSNRVRLPLPSRLELSITSGFESTQNISLRLTSTVKPSGLTRSTWSSETTQKALSLFKTPTIVIIEIKECKCALLLVLMRISGSAPGAIEALLIVLADKSVQ